MVRRTIRITRQVAFKPIEKGFIWSEKDYVLN